MAFAAATVVTTIGHAITADRLKTTPATYTTSPKFCAMGTGATGAGRTAVAADTALTTEVETRTSGTESSVTTTTTGDTYQVTGTQTATASRAVDEAMLLTASSAGSALTSATLAVVNLASGDSIAWTWRVAHS